MTDRLTCPCCGNEVRLTAEPITPPEPEQQEIKRKEQQMREILFRGKRTDNGQWVEGYYFTTPLTNENIMVPIEDGHYFMCGIQRHVIARNGAVFEVDRDTVGQYTELPDKNGKRIFEGDVLDCGDRIVYVKWHEQCGIWDSQFVKYTNNSLCSNGVTAVEWKFRALVIGNVHDNPELLESPYES